MLLDISHPGASELDAADAAALREHLEGCTVCATQAEHARRVDDHLGRAIREVAVPAGLRGRLLDRLAAKRAVRFRRRGLQVAACAAAVWLLASAFYYVRYLYRPVLDAEQIVVEIDARAFNSPEKVEEWFRNERGIVMMAPVQLNAAQLDYSLLDGFGMAEFQGVQVPLLVFFRPGSRGALARIYVLTDTAVNLDDQARPTRAAGSSHRVEVFRHPEDPRWIYVAIYTGESLNPFFIDHRPGV
jgi:hypothetical protein